MKFSDLLSMCVRNLIRRKYRTFLTVTGVVIGTCSIVVMISLGIGISITSEQSLQAMGSLTLINVNKQSQDTPIDDSAVALMQAMPNVEVAFPTMRYEPKGSWMNIQAGRKERYQLGWVNLVGVYPDAMEKMGYTVTEGELKLEKDKKDVINVVFGPEVAYQFYDTKRRGQNAWVDRIEDENGNIPDPFINPMETEMKLTVQPSKDKAKEVVFKVNVTGLLYVKENDWQNYMNMYTIFIDIAEMKKIRDAYNKENSIKPDKDQVESYEDVKVKVNHVDNVREVQDAIKEMGFYVSSMEDEREEMQKSAQRIQLILGALGGVSLFVAAISITNTMVMSVYERTREIGVMKVLGCLVGNIRTVFLMEAGLIGFAGGVVGIGVSYLLSYLMNRFGGSLGDILGMGGMGMMGEGAAKLSVIPLWLVLLGLIFSTCIGLASGFSPANRAVRISALEAIKQE